MNRRMSTIGIIARRELVTRARSKAFRVTGALLLLGLVLSIAIPALLARATGSHRYTVAVVAAQNAELRTAIDTRAYADGVTVTTHVAADRQAAAAQVEAGTVSAAVIADAGGELIWKSAADDRLEAVLRGALTQVAVDHRAQTLGLSPHQLGGLLAPAAPLTTTLHPVADRGPQTVIALVGMVLLFVALNFYGSLLLTGVVEEKTSRVVEVLLARVDAADLLAGKVLGIGLLGIGQFAALAAVGAATLEITRPPKLPANSLPLIAGVLMWFVLGYCFYSVLYAALGALASRIEDAQVVSAPLTTFLLIAYMGAFAAMAFPHAWWVTAASLLPPTAPMFMPLRCALTDVPAWQTGTAVVLILAAIPAVIALGGRLYRGGLLRTTGRVRVRQAWHSPH